MHTVFHVQAGFDLHLGTSSGSASSDTVVDTIVNAVVGAISVLFSSVIS